MSSILAMTLRGGSMVLSGGEGEHNGKRPGVHCRDGRGLAGAAGFADELRSDSAEGLQSFGLSHAGLLPALLLGYRAVAAILLRRALPEFRHTSAHPFPV